MALKSLIPWKKNGGSVPVHRSREETAFLDLRNQINRLFDEFFERPFSLSPFLGEFPFYGSFSPRVDISENDKEVTITAELPGMEPEDIHLTLNRNVLTISGEKRAEKEERGRRFYRVERSYGSFYRSIPLPADVNEDRIEATFKHGVLKVKLPKTAEAQKRSRRIFVKTD